MTSQSTDTAAPASRGAAESLHPRRRCGYCDNPAIPGLPHHLGWPVCNDHQTPEELMDMPLATDQIPDAIATIRDRLDFIERDAQDVADRYRRCHEAARRLARACYAAPLTDPEVTRAYDEFMALDSANFALGQTVDDEPARPL